MGEARSRNGSDEKCIKIMKGGNDLEDLDVHRRIILDRIHFAHDRDQWRALVNVEMNIRVSKTSGNYLTS
jgi:hypothetical protein